MLKSSNCFSISAVICFLVACKSSYHIRKIPSELLLHEVSKVLSQPPSNEFVPGEILCELPHSFSFLGTSVEVPQIQLVNLVLNTGSEINIF